MPGFAASGQTVSNLNIGAGGGSAASGSGIDWSKMLSSTGGGGKGGGGGSSPARGVPFNAAAIYPAYLQAYSQTFGGGMPMYDATSALNPEQKRAQAIASAGLGSGASDVALIALLLNKLFSGKKNDKALAYKPGSLGYETGSGDSIPGVNTGYAGFG